MGKATTLIGIMLFISIVSSLTALSIMSVDPSNPALASNMLYGSFNSVYAEANTSGSSWTVKNNYLTYTPDRYATGDPLSASSQFFPDWVYSGTKWITDTASVFFNMVGAPYTLAMMISSSSAGAVIGIGLCLFNLFIIVGWMLGKID